MLVVVVHVPAHAGVRDEVDLAVVQRRDAGQHDARAVGLNAAREVLLGVAQEVGHRDLLVRVVAAEVDAGERNESDLLLGGQEGTKTLGGPFGSRNHVQQLTHGGPSFPAAPRRYCIKWERYRMWCHRGKGGPHAGRSGHATGKSARTILARLRR